MTLSLQIALSALGYRPGALDGLWGGRTSAAMDAWRVGQLLPAAGTRPTAEELAAITAQYLSRQDAPPLTLAQLTAIAPLTRRQHYAVVESALLASLNRVVSLTAADSPMRAAHLLAQLAHESAGFKALTEYASGEAYNGRRDLGNTEPGDGPRYRGRGWIQLTGRSNYRAATAFLRAAGWADIDLEAEPSRAAHPDVAALTAAWYWLSRGLPALADDDDIEGITRAINGGLNGFEDRKVYLRRAKNALGKSL